VDSLRRLCRSRRVAPGAGAIRTVTQTGTEVTAGRIVGSREASSDPNLLVDSGRS